MEWEGSREYDFTYGKQTGFLNKEIFGWKYQKDAKSQLSEGRAYNSGVMTTDDSKLAYPSCKMIQ